MSSEADGPEERPRGDRQEFTAETRRPAVRWLLNIMLFAGLVTALCLAVWFVRMRVREMVTQHMVANLPLEDPAPTRSDARRKFALDSPIPSVPPSIEGTRPTPERTSPPPLPPLPIPSDFGTSSSATLPEGFNKVSRRADREVLQSASGKPATVRVQSMLVEPTGPAVGGIPFPPAVSPPPRALGPGNVDGLTGPLAASIRPTTLAAATAERLPRRDLLLARGAYIPCVLETQLISNIAGFVSCIVTDNIYSDDGHTVLLERGSHVSGEYKSDTRNGDSRLFVLWDRIKTPNGIVVDVASPGGDAVGGQGLPGATDNHWWERIGAAFLLSSFQDVIAIGVARETAQNIGTSINTAPTNTTGAAQDLSKEVLSATINIPPTLYKNRGELLTIYVARDLWFGSVYALHR